VVGELLVEVVGELLEVSGGLLAETIFSEELLEVSGKSLAGKVSEELTGASSFTRSQIWRRRILASGSRCLSKWISYGREPPGTP
jgi:hypothetical protein